MKKILLSLLVVLGFATQVRADEGMWFLKMMEEQHLEDSLRKAGLQLPASALYNENGPSAAVAPEKSSAPMDWSSPTTIADSPTSTRCPT